MNVRLSLVFPQSNIHRLVPLNDALNPYEPPFAEASDSWWARLMRWIRFKRAKRKRIFRRGDPVICNGIAFYIDPSNSKVLYAASPSMDLSDQRMNLIVAETLRALPWFLAENPDTHVLLAGRSLTIRIVKCYRTLKSEVEREEAMEWDVLRAILSEQY